MEKMRRSLFHSVIALILCFSMLLGTTYAWFTDSVTSANNIIKAGNLDLEVWWTEDLTSASWKNAEDANSGAIFDYDKWEPGYTCVRYIKLVNNGDLAFKYLLNVIPNGDMGILADVIDVYYVENAQANVDSVENMTAVGTLADVVGKKVSANGVLLPEGTSESGFYSGEIVVAIALSMQESAGNEYQGKSIGTSFSIELLATQYSYEEDVFGKDYDTDAEWPNKVSVGDNEATAPVTPDANNKLTADTALANASGKISATVPAGTSLAQNTTELTLSVSDMSKSEANITLDENEASLSVDVHIEGIAADNEAVIAVDIAELLPVGLNMGNYRLYHVEGGATVAMTLLADGATPAHNNYEYDPATGDVTLYLKSFSEVALVADTENAWEGKVADAFAGGTGTETDPYLIANADQFVYFGDLISNDNDNYGDKYYKLIADINYGGEDNANEGKLFYPIGYHKVGGAIAALDADDAPEFVYQEEDPDYAQARVSAASDDGAAKWYTYGGSFKGVFDGDGHTVANIYQNTWQLKGNYSGNYWNAAMGLFGYVNGGTVKNLTVDNFSSDGEFTPTGVIAAYATNSTFENIAITNCNPRVYNTGNGGIVGIGGNSNDPDTYKLTFTNITIDNTNKISALWGSWDVACGGLVGMFRGAGHVHMTNCHVAAQIDVFNDVCGNYQYYWYRYSGMMIGTNKNMTTDANGYTVPETDKFHAENCTVHFGEWNDYYYCELVANSLASYTHDHQFSRLTEISSLDEIKSGDTWTKAGNFLLISDDTKTCYHIVNKNGTLTQHLHTDAGEETVGGETVLKEDKQIVYLPFNQLFTGYGWGVKHIPVYNGVDYAFEGITILDREVADSVEKFDSKFTGDFLYRVGNGNAVSIGSLFAAKDGMTINDSGVWVTIEKVDEKANVSGKFTANTTDWTKGTIQFSGTGVVKVTIQDYDYCKPTELILEVVDAVNATAATSATENNVVLLNDIGSGFTVSNGYAFYGNGFKVTCSGKGTYLGNSGLSLGYITVENGGILDNVKVVCNKFPASYLYAKEVTEIDEELSTDGKNRYKYQLSAVALGGDGSVVSNCYIIGARNNVFVSQGNVTISNTVLESGSFANIQIKSTDAYTVTFDNVTTIQKSDVKADFDTSVHVLGFGVVVGDNESASNPTIKLNGEFTQYNWVSSADADNVKGTYAKAAINGALGVADYQHTFDGTTKVNMGIAYLNTQKATITDNRTDKDTVPYVLKEVSMAISGVNVTGQVYSVSNAKGVEDTPPASEDMVLTPSVETMPEVVWSGESNDALTFEKVFDGDWKYRLTVDLDNIAGGSYNFLPTHIKAQKYGQALAFTIKDANGNKVENVTLNALTTNEYVLEITDNLNYDANGELVDGSVVRYIPFILYATKTSIDPPEFTNQGTATAIRLVTSKGGDWRPAYTVLTGVSVNYWSASEGKTKTVDISTLYNSGTISSNVWTYTCDDYTLTITGGAVHSDGSTITPVVANSTLYFASTNKAFGTGTTSRSIILTYVFTDKNASTTWNRTETVNYGELSEYDYNSFKNDGELAEPSSGGCVTPDTLITLADGTQMRVDALTGHEELLVWNLETGELDKAPIMFIDYEEEAEFEVVCLTFSDGTTVKVIYEHGFWDYDLNQYVYLDANAADYIGHTFAKQNGNALEKVTLDRVEIKTETVMAWSPVTVGHLCYFVNGMLSMPGGVSGLFNFFEVDPETMTYDAEAMQKDIEKYGLYTYEEMYELCPLTEEMFEAAGGKYLKVSVKKGYLTEVDLVYMITRYSIYFNLLNS